jgi:DNA-binding HxlR family transcriptional regulator
MFETNSDYFFKLTLGVYKVTDLYPKEEPLTVKTRERALRILADLISASPNPGIKKLENVAPAVENNIEIILELFDLAEHQNWVNSKNFAVLEREYRELGESLKKEAEKREKPNWAGKSSLNPEKKEKEKKLILNKRQEKILELLREKRSAQTGDILKSFDGLSKRTLRRDLRELAEQKIVERVGKCNLISYKVTGTDSAKE